MPDTTSPTEEKRSLFIDRIGQIAIPVTDLERATAFYRDVLGIRFLFSAPPGLAFFDCGGIRLMLEAASPDGSERHSPVIYYNISDLDGAYQTLRAQGVTIEAAPHRIAVMPDHELWMAFFRDPDANLIGLMSERRG